MSFSLQSSDGKVGAFTKSSKLKTEASFAKLKEFNLLYFFTVHGIRHGTVS